MSFFLEHQLLLKASDMRIGNNSLIHDSAFTRSASPCITAHREPGAKADPFRPYFDLFY